MNRTCCHAKMFWNFLFSNLIGLAYKFPSNKLLDTQVLIKNSLSGNNASITSNNN